MNFSKYKLLLLAIIIGTISMSSSCDKPTPEPEITTGKLNVEFDFYWDNDPVEYDTLIYTNEAGNEYLIYEIQFFITRLTIYKEGTATVLNGWQNEHYFDTEIPSTLSWPIVDEIEAHNYDSISFTFGFKDSDNESFMFANPPENIMIWPEYNGGGYHYMKINGKWLDPNNYLRGSAFHIGKGQIYDTNGDITGYIDNSFSITLPNSSFSISATNTTNVKFRMHVEEWFKNPNAYDHNTYGGDIMENQEAMNKGCENAWNVFEFVK